MRRIIEAVLAAAASPTLPHRILELACEIVDVTEASLVVLGADDTVADFVTTAFSPERRAITVRRGAPDILGRVVATGRPVRALTRDDPCLVGLRRDHADVRVLAVPLAGVEGRGVLWTVRPAEGDEFTDADEDRLCSLAAVAGLTLENAGLRAEAQAGEPALTAFREVTQALLERRPTDEVLRRLARSARLLLGADLVMIVTRTTGSSIVVRVADGRGAREMEGTRLSTHTSLAGQVLRSRRSVVVAAGGGGVPQYQNRGLNDNGPAVVTPMIVGDRAYGTFIVTRGENGSDFVTDELRLAQALATEAAMALEHGQIRSDLDRLPILEERERIAMELHDGVVQALFVVGLSLQAAELEVDNADHVRKTLSDAIDRIDRTIRDLRNYIFGLRPIDMADRHLERALREVVDSFRISGRVSTSLDLDPRAASTLSPRSATIIQAAREAMSNAVQHSGGDHVELRFLVVGDEVLLEVIDNGTGFRPEQVVSGGRGLSNLRARAEALGGTLEIDAEPGGGACVRLRIPV